MQLCKENLTEIILFIIHYRQSGDRFVVKVKPVQIKGVRMIVEHKIEALPDRKVRIKWRRVLHMLEAVSDASYIHLTLAVPIYTCQLVLEGRATVVCLNKDFRPTRVFPELSARAKEVFSCKVA
jgi:acyl-CoA thioesterase FadM